MTIPTSRACYLVSLSNFYYFMTLSLGFGLKLKHGKGNKLEHVLRLKDTPKNVGEYKEMNFKTFK
jgi:hypothetical protein